MPAPLILSTWSFGQRGNEAAWPGLAGGGHSIDAVQKVCEVVDADPEVDSVGLGGLPDASGHVTLDGCIMLAPNRCGSVCAVRRFMHPVSIARRVMERTQHVMLAGGGADAFAEQEGFLPADLLAANAQDAWEKWKKDHVVADQTRDRGVERQRSLRPIDRTGSGRLFLHPGPSEDQEQDDESKWKHHDTIGVLALDSQGVLAGGCSTSGTPFKLPGRVGDSPIIGHGLYVDPEHGAAVATGAGELIMGICGSFLVVECMRRGASPADALRQTLQRICDAYEIREDHQVAMIALRPDGRWSSAALRPGYKTSRRSASRSEVLDPELVLLNR
jgi:L-asparaginase/N4-(beta-N-acetylglucosaminyl)-L-asparaginase